MSIEETPQTPIQTPSQSTTAKRIAVGVGLVLIGVAVALSIVWFSSRGMSDSAYQSAVRDAHQDAMSIMVKGTSEEAARTAVDTLINELHEMKPPKRVRAQHEAMIDVYQENRETLPAIAKAAQLLTSSQDKTIFGKIIDAIGGAQAIAGAYEAKQQLDSIEKQYKKEGLIVYTLASPENYLGSRASS